MVEGTRSRRTSVASINTAAESPTASRSGVTALGVPSRCNHEVEGTVSCTEVLSAEVPGEMYSV